MKYPDKERLARREFLKRVGVAAAGLGLVACAPAALPTPTPTKAPPASTPAAKAPAATPTPSDAETTAKLYEAARKEGELMVYGAGTVAEWEELAAEFAKQYPGIKAAGFMGTSEAVRDKVLTEARARKPVGDVLVRTIFQDVYPFSQEGVLDSYLSPQAKSYDDKWYDPKGLWYINAWYPHLIEFNTQQVPKEQGPKSYQDLLKPEFRGKLGLESNAIPWFTAMLKIMGRDRGLDYMKKLAEQKPRLVAGHTNLHKLVVSGEIPVAVYMYSFRAVVDKDKGAPIEWVEPAESTSGDSILMATIKNAAHPNAARLMVDFVLSEAGAKVFLKQSWIPTRRGMDLGNMAAVARVKAAPPTDPVVGKEVADNEKIFREIFGKP